MKYLSIADIEHGVFRGNPSTRVNFSGEGFRYGALETPKTVIDRIKEIDTPYVVLGGGEPFDQNMLSLIGLCYVLKRRLRKKVIVETKGHRFNQLLFLNVKHFNLHPTPESFREEKFKRFMKYSSYKTLAMGRTPDHSFPVRPERWNYTKFVEVEFDIRKPGDMAFASRVFNDYIKGTAVKTHINRAPEYSSNDYGKDLKEYYNTFVPYTFMYISS